MNFKTTTTLGLKLVDVLTKQLEGDLELDQSQGTEFKIKFCQVKT
jgi:two-component sensor histidine kinase